MSFEENFAWGAFIFLVFILGGIAGIAHHKQMMDDKDRRIENKKYYDSLKKEKSSSKHTEEKINSSSPKDNQVLIPPMQRETSSPSKIKVTIHKSSGKLHCFVGPMFSGKTTAMLAQVVKCADVTGECALIINHLMDKGRAVGNGNTDLGISSHSSQFSSISAKLKTVYAEKLSDVNIEGYDIISVDEVAFYPDLYDTITEWLLLGKHIYCAGLDGDFKMSNFGQVHKLLPISDTFTKLSAVCQLCTEEYKGWTPDMFINAPFTAKISGDMNTKVDQGGKDKYRAVCRYHYLEINKNNDTNINSENKKED